MVYMHLYSIIKTTIECFSIIIFYFQKIVETSEKVTSSTKESFVYEAFCNSLFQPIREGQTLCTFTHAKGHLVHI